jgi:HNH endonuclease
MASSMPKPWARLYHTRRWERRSKLNLKMFKYLCQECLKAGKVEPATLSHHVHEWTPSSSELDFWFGELTALCANCHAAHHGFNISKETFDRDIDGSGWPCDPMHPVYQTDVAKREGSKP